MLDFQDKDEKAKAAEALVQAYEQAGPGGMVDGRTITAGDIIQARDAASTLRAVADRAGDDWATALEAQLTRDLCEQTRSTTSDDAAPCTRVIVDLDGRMGRQGDR